MMAHPIITIFAICCVSSAIIFVAVWRAREGREGSRGFHQEPAPKKAEADPAADVTKAA
jgi:hypothetical protein